MFHGGGDGERIVAFGRVGKPPENPLFACHSARPIDIRQNVRNVGHFRNGF